MVTLSWTELEEIIKREPLVIFPIGVIEAHGPHLSLGVDIYGSYLKSKLAKRLLEASGITTLIAPPLYWGINHVTSAFPGSFTVKESTMKSLILDSIESMKSWGLKRIFLVNHHGDYKHCGALLEGAKEAADETGLEVKLIISPFDAKRFKISPSDSHTLIMKEPSTPGKSAGNSPYIDIHAGKEESSMMAKHFPEEIDRGLTEKLKATNYTMEDLMEWRKGGEHAKAKTPHCYFGAPAEFNLEDNSIELEAEMIYETIKEYLNADGKLSESES